jgi:hypothetical protein
MTPEEYARSEAEIDANLAKVRAIVDDIAAWKKQWDAEEPKRLRRRIKIELALERQHKANKALRAALPS